MSSLWSDFRFVARSLRRAPLFAFLVVLTLAIGIGATSSLFSVVYGVLLAPPSFAGPVDGPVVIAWNASVEASRAVAAAMPLLAAARSVHIVSIDEPGKPFDATPLATQLGWHRIASELRATTLSDRHVAEALLDECHTLGASLLVMGGYTHSRFREMIFGGVTQHLIRHAPLPVLMAH